MAVLLLAALLGAAAPFLGHAGEVERKMARSDDGDLLVETFTKDWESAVTVIQTRTGRRSNPIRVEGDISGVSFYASNGLIVLNTGQYKAGYWPAVLRRQPDGSFVLCKTELGLAGKGQLKKLFPDGWSIGRRHFVFCEDWVGGNVLRMRMDSGLEPDDGVLVPALFDYDVEKAAVVRIVSSMLPGKVTPGGVDRLFSRIEDHPAAKRSEERLNLLYKRTRERLGAKGQADLLTQQRAWLKERETHRADPVQFVGLTQRRCEDFETLNAQNDFLPVGRWDINISENRMTDTADIHFNLSAAATIQVDGVELKPKILVSVATKPILINIGAEGAYAGREHRNLLVRWDKQAAKAEPFLMLGDSVAPQNSEAFLQRLSSSKNLLIEFRMNSGITRVMEFEPEGLRAAIAFYEELRSNAGPTRKAVPK